MPRTPAQSSNARQALALVEGLQRRFVERLEAVSATGTFGPVEWLRDGGRHGGGERWAAGESDVFNRASVNVSQVQYEDDPSKKLASASAISAIVHPKNPNAPSYHMHISWTETKDGKGYWRVMADLNPAIVHQEDADRFRSAVQAAAGELWDEGRAQGERYFHIPALDRHRGVVHFYLEGHADVDEAYARKVGEAAIDEYTSIVGDTKDRTIAEGDREQQIAYHTVYLFQVLTLDRGTTSGLLIHNENDVGIMGSLPSHVDRDLLASWADKVPKPQDELVRALVAQLPDASPSEVTVEVKQRLAEAVRAHFTAHPAALNLQASGGKNPPTVDNHR